MIEVYIYASLFFILGTILGSFYNVVAYRLPNNMSIVIPPSHCPKCNKRLGFMELIPVLSYFLLGGKCKHCKKKIPFFYPLFEFITGVIFVISYLIFGMSFELMVALTFSSTLLIIIISDTKYMIIPDELLLFTGILLFMERIVMGRDYTLLIIDALVPFIVLYLIKLFGDTLFKRESLGGGDIKLMILFGIVLGYELSIFAIFLGSLVALPLSLIILKIKKTNVIPFGPFLSVAALIIYYSGLSIKWIFSLLF